MNELVDQYFSQCQTGAAPDREAIESQHPELAPILGRIFQSALSRRRETLADVSAVQMTRYPPGLISALEKLEADSTVTHSASRATAHLWIEQPMSGVGDRGKFGAINRLFDTHPPLEERIALLREL